MRRKTNRVFRYFFPVVILGTSLVFLTQETSKDAAQDVIYEKEAIAVSEKTQAKMLKMVSHNPQTQARLFVNANEATQHSDKKIALSNPVGTFEKPEGQASLKAVQASYYEANREVHFFKKVSFDHHSGLTATTEHAVLNTQTQDISGSQGVEARHQENKITAKSYEIQTGKNVMCFSGNVCLNVSRKNIQ